MMIDKFMALKLTQSKVIIGIGIAVTISILTVNQYLKYPILRYFGLDTHFIYQGIENGDIEIVRRYLDIYGKI